MSSTPEHKTLFTPEAYAEMTAWFDSPLGQHLLAAERHLLDNILARRFGYHLLQLGCADLRLHDQSPIGHKFSFRPWQTAGAAAGHAAIADMEAIPLASESVDLVLLHHALDFSEYQHQLLREVERVLIAGGHVVIVGFNPLSSWGLRNRLQLFRRKAPWHASMLGTNRLIDWLKLLDFQVDQVRYGMYSLPVNSENIIRYSGLLDPVASHLNWPTGGIYAISARKQVLPLTPVQTRWRSMPVHGLGLPMPDKVGQVSRHWISADNEDSMS